MHRFNVLDDLASPVLDHSAAAGATDQLIVHRQLDAFLAFVLDTGEAEHVRGHFAGRIIATVFILFVDARQAERQDFRGHVGGDLPLDENEVTVGRQLATEFMNIHLQQARQIPGLRRRQTRIFRNRPDRLDRCRYRQHVVVAIHDATARRRDLDLPFVAGLTLLLQEVVLEHLQVERATDQGSKARQHENQDKTRPPRRQALQQHGALRELHFSRASSETI